MCESSATYECIISILTENVYTKEKIHNIIIIIIDSNMITHGAIW